MAWIQLHGIRTTCPWIQKPYLSLDLGIQSWPELYCRYIPVLFMNYCLYFPVWPRIWLVTLLLPDDDRPVDRTCCHHPPWVLWDCVLWVSLLPSQCWGHPWLPSGLLLKSSPALTAPSHCPSQSFTDFYGVSNKNTQMIKVVILDVRIILRNGYGPFWYIKEDVSIQLCSSNCQIHR